MTDTIWEELGYGEDGCKTIEECVAAMAVTESFEVEFSLCDPDYPIVGEECTIEIGGETLPGRVDAVKGNKVSLTLQKTEQGNV